MRRQEGKARAAITGPYKYLSVRRVVTWTHSGASGSGIAHPESERERRVCAVGVFRVLRSKSTNGAFLPPSGLAPQVAIASARAAGSRSRSRGFSSERRPRAGCKRRRCALERRRTARPFSKSILPCSVYDSPQTMPLSSRPGCRSPAVASPSALPPGGATLDAGYQPDTEWVKDWRRA